MTNQLKSENRMPRVPLTCVIVINTETPLTCPLYFLSIRNLHVAQSAHFYHYPLSVSDLIPINGSIHTTQCALPTTLNNKHLFEHNEFTYVDFFLLSYLSKSVWLSWRKSFFFQRLVTAHTCNRNVLNRIVRHRRCISVKVMSQHAHQWKDRQIIN